MGRVTVCTVLISLLLIHLSRGANWVSGPQDGATEYACAGGSVTLPWKFSLSSGDTIHDIQWSYSGHSQELIALFSRDSFVPLPAFSHRVQFVANGGLQIDHVTVADSGNYTVDVSWTDSSGAVITLRRFVIVQVLTGDTVMTTGKAFYMKQTPAAVLDTTSNQWTIELRCGHFTFQGQPPFDLQWITPSETIHNSSEYREGQFLFHLPTPVTGGTYTCRVSAQSAHVCLSADREASLTVDSTTARLSILEAKAAAAEAKLATSEARLTASEAKQAAFEAKQPALLADNDRLKQEMEHLKSLNSRQVSFTARYLPRSSEPTQKYDRLLVREIISNQGNAYNSTSGTFTAPYNGTYFFAATSGPNYNNDYGGFKLYAGGHEAAFVSAKDASGAEAATEHAVVHLTTGDRVYLVAYDTAYYYSSGTMFSGFLITPDP